MDETTQTYEPAGDVLATHHLLEDDAHIRYVTDEEAWGIFDETARREMGISGEEFLRRWDAGEWQDDPDHYPVMNVISMLAFAR